MGCIHTQTKCNKDKIKQRSAMHKLMANAQLQTKNQTFKAFPRS